MGSLHSPAFVWQSPSRSIFPVRPGLPGPPPLKSRGYAKAFDEVKEYGALDSSVRSEDQTAYAIWWMEFAEGSVNRLARQLAAEQSMDLWAAARMFAHVGSALFDTYVAVWDSRVPLTTTGAPTPLSGRLIPTAIPERHQNPRGNRSARLRHFRNTCRGMPPHAQPRSGSSRTRLAAMCRSRCRRRQHRLRCRRARSKASGRPLQSAPTHACVSAGIFAMRQMPALNSVATSPGMRRSTRCESGAGSHN